MAQTKIVQFFWVIVILSFLETIFACSTPGRCSQYYSLTKLHGNVKAIDEISNPIFDLVSEENNVEYGKTIKFRVSARGLTSKPYNMNQIPNKPNSFAKVWINSRLDDRICKVQGNQNPIYGEEFSVTYNDGDNSYVKIEVWNEEMDSFIGISWPVQEILGHAIFYVKDMTVSGRLLESPLWNNDVDNFNTGIAILNIGSVTRTKLNKKDEL